MQHETVQTSEDRN